MSFQVKFGDQSSLSSAKTSDPAGPANQDASTNRGRGRGRGWRGCGDRGNRRRRRGGQGKNEKSAANDGASDNDEDDGSGESDGGSSVCSESPGGSAQEQRFNKHGRGRGGGRWRGRGGRGRAGMNNNPRNAGSCGDLLSLSQQQKQHNYNPRHPAAQHMSNPQRSKSGLLPNPDRAGPVPLCHPGNYQPHPTSGAAHYPQEPTRNQYHSQPEYQAYSIASGKASGQKGAVEGKPKQMDDGEKGRQGPRSARGSESDLQPKKEESKQHKDKPQEDIPDLDPDEWIKIFNLLLKQFKGRTKLGTLMSQKGDLFKGLTHAKAAAWLKHSNRFLTFEKEGKVKAVSISFKEARMCFKYRKHNTDKCENTHCPFFHICREFVSGNCTRGSDCHFNHSFHSRSNAKVSKEAGLLSFTDEDICWIVFRSTPVVCNSFNTTGCNDDCPDLHVCSNFIRRECSDEDCKFGHTIKGTEHNKWVLNTFHMMGINELTLKQMVIVPKINTLEDDGNKNAQPADQAPISKGIKPMKPQEKTAAMVKSQSNDDLNVDEALAPPTHQPQPSAKPAKKRIRVRTQTMPKEKYDVSQDEGGFVGGPEDRESSGEAENVSATSTGPARNLQIKAWKKPNQKTNIEEEKEQTELSDSHYTHLCEQFTWKGDCSRGYTCPRYHHRDRPPYIWQLKIFGGWQQFDINSDNVDIEERYCALAATGEFEVLLDDLGGLQVTMDLNDMKAITVDSSGQKELLEMQRWSTPSYVEAEPGTDLNMYTQWCWYMNVGGRFRPFLPAELQYTLEEKFIQGQEKYYYERGDKRFLVWLKDKVMFDLDSNLSTCVLRRPYFSLVDAGASAPHMCNLLLKEPPLVPFPNLPDHWSSVDHYQDFEMVEMALTSTEYRQVMRSFHSTLSLERVMILRIFRVQNPSLWDKFCSTKRTMTPRDRSADDVDERKLFHGTPTLLAARGICTNSMDFRRAGDNVGARFGRGSYFSTSARYSNDYTSGTERYMFLARVLVGKFTRGDPSYKTPPVREGLKLYDSCVNDVANPTIFVIFDLAQSYPEYLIQYEKVEEGPVVGGAGYHLSRPVTASQTAAAVATQHRLHPVQPAVAAPYTSASSQRQPVSAVQTPVPAPRTSVQKSHGVGLASHDPLQKSDLVDLAAYYELLQASRKTPSRPSTASSQAQYPSTARVGHVDPVSPDRGVVGASAYSPHAATARDSMPSRPAGDGKKSGENRCVIS